MRTKSRSGDSGEVLLRQMAARRRRDNIIVTILAVLAVLGGGHAVLSWFDSPPPGPSDETTVGIIGRSQLAQSFAREFVVTYLTASTDQQERVAQYVSAGQQITLPSNHRQVADSQVVHAARKMSAGNVEVWSVTVSVQMGGASGAAAAGKDGPIRQYYRVAVSVTDGLRALAIPTLVERPARGGDLALSYSATCAADTPLAQVAIGFVKAYLSGSGDMNRYTVLNSEIVAPSPSPFTTVETASVTSDDSGCGTTGSTAHVLATVNAKGAEGGIPTLAYPLTLVRNTGQWQVQSVDPIPALRTPLTIVADQTQGGGAPAQATTTAPSTAVSVPPARQN
ncbi:conjugal transfer protein [Nocardia wallacei]|uniref:conjugal transfer protein n=1 Tax=Nocardia wallacei TaxID=480035 RepID=UPI0024550B4A|nr:conjugal transfer protein [Nocardia wallacei]